MSAYDVTESHPSDGRAVLDRVLPEGEADRVWDVLLSSAGLSGAEDDPTSVTRMVQVMVSTPDRLVALSAPCPQVRLAARAHLSAIPTRPHGAR